MSVIKTIAVSVKRYQKKKKTVSELISQNKFSVVAGNFPYLYFMPVSFPVDSFREMWCLCVKEPRLRAIRATVRNRARAALAVFGLDVFCLFGSLVRGAFNPWSVHAKDTCMTVSCKGSWAGETDKACPGSPRESECNFELDLKSWRVPISEFRHSKCCCLSLS